MTAEHLPPLPEPQRIGTHYPRGVPEPLLAYTAEQMYAFRQEGVEAERERCARIVESVDNCANPMTALDCAAAIRGAK